MESRHGGLTLGRRIGLGSLMGLFWWPRWALVILAPAIAEAVGVPEGFVGATAIAAGVGGSVLFGFTPVGRNRRRAAICSVALTVLPVAALGFTTTGLAFIALLVLVGALSMAGDAAVQSTVTATLTDDPDRRSGMAPYWLARVVLWAVGGPVCEWAAGRFGIPALFAGLAVICLVIAAVLVCLCPDADGPVVRQQRETQSVATEEHGSLWSVTVASFCGNAQATVFVVFVPLGLAERGVAGAGWTQAAFVFGVLTFALSARTTRAGTPVISARTSARLGPPLICAASLVALVGEVVVDGAVMLVVVAAAVRTISSMGNSLHGCTLSAVVGVTARGKSVVYAGAGAGGLFASLGGGAIWTTVAPGARYEVLLVGALVLGIASHIATRRWVDSWPEVSAASAGSGNRMVRAG